jgi:GntR family transcriptional regulator
VITMAPEQARYRQIADEIRRQIEVGILPAGASLPTEAEMIDQYQVARGTVREALALLRSEGLITTARYRGSQVRPRWPVRRISMDRYRVEVEQRDDQPAEKATSFTKDQGIAWDQYTLDKVFAEVPAQGSVAELLDVPEGTPLLRREFVFRTHGVPQQISTSYLLLDMVAGTPVADPDNEPWPGGNIAQLATLGVRVTQVREQVRTRTPTPDESRILRIGEAVPVFTISRTMLADARPVEAAVEIIIPGDRVVLDYYIDLKGADAEPQPVVAAIVTSKRGVLVGRRNDGKPPWTFIAGEIEPGESPADAAIREVKEETGLAVRAAEREIGRRVHPKTGRTMIYLACHPTGKLDPIVGDEDELAEVRWVSLAEAQELLPGMHEPVLEHLRRELT